MASELKNEVICRTCLSEINKNDTISIYTVSEIIMSCSTVQISEFDGLPSYICNNCHDIARKAYDFRVLCEASDKELRSRLLDDEESKIFIKEEIIDEASSPQEDNYANDITENDTKFSPLKCNFCDMTFLYMRDLNKHEFDRHKRESDRHKKSVQKCSKCGKTFLNSKRLSIHLRHTHNRVGGLLCSTCGKQFTLPENFLRHQKIHTGKKQYQCTHCNKSFFQSGELKSHMVTHTSEKAFLCSFCGNKFARKQSLRTHIRRIHSNSIRSHTCNVCGRGFKDRQDLGQHKRIHTEQRKHVCKICSKAFNRRSNLTVHERTHSGHRPHTCTICQRSFIQKHVLNTHMQKIHHT